MSESLRYGLTPTGFTRMRLPEIRRRIYDDLNAATGEVFDESPDSLIGQIVGVWVDREAALWELAEKLFYTPYPATAPDMALDLAVSYAGVTRLQPAATEARVVLGGEPGTVVPARSEVGSNLLTPTGQRLPPFRLSDEVTISGAVAALMRVDVGSTPTVGTLYTFDWNGVRTSAVATSGQSSGGVAQALANALTAVGATVTVNGTEITVTSAGAFSGEHSANMTLKAVASPGRAVCVEPGPVEVPAGALDQIRTPAPGWTSVGNPDPAIPGRSLETEFELRRRYPLGVYQLGSGTQPSIFANLAQDVAGMTALAVYENNTNTTDAEGRLPHSIEVVIEGGDDVYIARRIYELKGGGIDTNGTTLRQVAGRDGRLHPIRFSRPQTLNIWLLASLLTATEEVVPGDQAARALKAIVDAGNLLQPGQDVFLQRLSAEVFKATTGVAKVNLRAVALAPNSAQPNPSAYTTADILVGSRQRARFSLARAAIG